ncbi:DDE-type integrase/transposase/recombinase [Mesorhizobium sp. M0220]|uniref:DDE-type integrase/transposase/recombinase n=1 Tax=Mesorhizobium sp. M0220 TaxID=2956920 RepID=UPI003335E136
MIVNHKKIRRLMREHDLQPRMRQHYTVTTDSDHNQPIFPNLARDIICDGANQLWVADITYVTVGGGLAYVAVVLDAWSRRVVGYAISRSIDARLTLAALTAAVEGRKPPPGCMHHSYRDHLAAPRPGRFHGPRGTNRIKRLTFERSNIGLHHRTETASIAASIRSVVQRGPADFAKAGSRRGFILTSGRRFLARSARAGGEVICYGRLVYDALGRQ